MRQSRIGMFDLAKGALCEIAVLPCAEGAVYELLQRDLVSETCLTDIAAAKSNVQLMN